MASKKKINRDQLIEEIMDENPTLSADEVAAMADAQIAGEEEVKESEAQPVQAPVSEAKYTEADMLAMAKILMEKAGHAPEKKSKEPVEDKRVDHLINMLEKQEGFHIKPFNHVPDDPDDRLDEPVTFFANTQRLAIYGSEKFGRTISPPFDVPIIFTNPIRQILSGPTKGTDKWLVYSYFTTYSKKQRDFLLNHEELGGRVHLKPADALATDPFFANMRANVYRDIISLSAGDVITRSKSMGLQIIDNIEVMRDTLANAIVKQRMEAEHGSQKAAIERLSDIQGMTDAKRMANAR